MTNKQLHFTITFLVLLLSVTSLAQQPKQHYMMPPKAIADLVDAPFTPRISISPDNTRMLFLYYPGLPSIAEVSQPELRLAGLRINPRTNGPSRGWYYNKMTVKNITTDKEQEITGLPERPHITNVRWSPDSKKIAFVITKPDHLELWYADIISGKAKRLSTVSLNSAVGNPFSWVSDSKTLIALTTPADRGTPPQKPSVPTGPIIQENLKGKAPARTYQDLLKSPYDEIVFTYYTTSQIVKIDINGNTILLGQPDLYTFAGPSPDGNYVLVKTIQRPFSYTVPYYRFPLRTEVWNITGQKVARIADLPLADNIPVPFGSVRTGRRLINWRHDTDATLYWVEALDDGDAGKDVTQRDRVYLLPAPFDGTPQPLITLGLRFDEILWGEQNTAIVTEFWWKTRETKSWLVSPDSPETSPRLIIDRSFEDRYSDPGQPLMKHSKHGFSVLLTGKQGKTIFLTGKGASPEGDRPFLDEFDLSTHGTTRLFHSRAPYYEQPVSLLDISTMRLLTRRESTTEPPNYFIRNVKNDNEKLKQLTSFPHPTPQLANVKKELIRYKRADGVDLTATLYLPPDYSPEQDGPLPMLMWAYPREYKSANAAGQVTDSPYRFVRIRWYSPLLFLAHGYAVLDNPSMPIIGEEGEEPNDTYVEQLVASAKAAVNEVVRRGVADRNRIAIGGHSYGAFMAANLLAHSDLFAAGIARSGAYNRTLTPFGFQSEERTFWEAPDVYFAMSPFMHADKINEPILLIHGMADNNSGTYPLQSERFYAALKGLGATAKLVMLPAESHGYRARESIMHVLYEMSNWMDAYVKSNHSYQKR